MAALTDFTNALFGAANTASKVVDDYTTNQAKLSTQSKQIKLQADINNELMKIQQSSDYTNWQQNMTDFFQRVKSGMGDKNSQYYCENNLQAEMFTSILEENQVGVSQKVNQMVYGRQRDSALVDYTNNLSLLAQQYSGQDYITKANEGAKMLYDLGYIDESQYQKQLDSNYTTAYSDLYLNTFNESLKDGLAQNKSFEALYADMQKNMPNLIATDTAGLPKTIDKEALDNSIKKTLQQNYKAALSDIQQGNANRLSEIVQQMRQSNTAEGKVAVARRGQSAMNGMLGLQLSETDRLQYSAIFELALGGDLTGSGNGGSGSGSSKATDSYENLIKASPDTAVQLWLDGKYGNMYDITNVVSDNLLNEWFTGTYKENVGKGFTERNEEYETIYKGKISSDTLTESISKKLAEKFPTAKNYIDNNFKNLITDIQKNPKNYGDATVGQLSMFILDWLGESTSDMTDDDFVNAFKKHVNDCYVESCKYMELNKKGEIEKKYDATNAKDIASAAQLLHDKDMVYTYNGQEMWAPGKKEALEAKGGLVDVMKNAVAGTIGADASGLNFYYQRSKDDMTNVPIITYKGQSYEVNATEDGKGFTVTNLTTGEVMDGVVPNNKVARTAAKAEAKAEVKAAAKDEATLRKQREEKLQTKLTETKTTPKAVEVANVIPDEEKAWKWETSTNEDRTDILRKARNKIDSDAKEITKAIKESEKKQKKQKNQKKQENQMTKEKFKEKWNIDYDDWIADETDYARFDLILNSK